MSFIGPIRAATAQTDDAVEKLVRRIVHELAASHARDAVAPSRLERSRALYRHRRKRRDHFDGQLFVEPAWDILLDLFIAEDERRTITVSSACIAAAVPTTTALRCLNSLRGAGLIVRRPHPTDARCAVVSLSDAARAAMEAYLDSLD